MAKRKFVTVVDYSTVSKQQKLQHMPRQHDFFDGKNSNFSLMFIRQSLVPLILASIGLVFAGWTLDYAEVCSFFYVFFTFLLLFCLFAFRKRKFLLTLRRFTL